MRWGDAAPDPRCEVVQRSVSLGCRFGGAIPAVALGSVGLLVGPLGLILGIFAFPFGAVVGAANGLLCGIVLALCGVTRRQPGRASLIAAATMAVFWTVLLGLIHWMAGPVSVSEAVVFAVPSVLTATVLAPAVVSQRERRQWRPRSQCPPRGAVRLW